MRTGIIAACFSLPIAVSPLSAATIHVSPDGSGDYSTIQAAIDAAASGDEILLSDGIFTGDGNWNLDFGTKELVLRSESGYEATTLDGEFVCIEFTPLRSAVIMEGGQTGATRIEGLTIQHFLTEGGLVRCVGSSPVIRACRFRLNFARWEDSLGLSIVVQSGAPTIADCVFEGNGCYHGGSEGIALYARDSWVTLDGCTFSAIEVLLGGLVNIDGGAIADCVFASIRSSDEHPSARCVRVSDGEVSIQNCRFVHTFGNGVSVEDGAQVLIGNCAFEHNVSDAGCCVSTSGRTTIRNTSFLHNYSGFVGGIIECFGATVTLDDCVFLDSKNGWPGGASAIYASSTNLHVTHCTFVGNRSTFPDYRGSTLTISQHTQLLMDHTIIAFGGQAGLPDGAIHCIGLANVDVSCSDFYGNDGGDWTGCLAGMDEVNKNFSADPLLCDVAAEDLSLHGDSPCAPPNSGECGLIGALGPWCGPLAVQRQSWGSIKALYR